MNCLENRFYTYLKPKDFVAILVLVLKVIYCMGEVGLGLKYFTNDHKEKAG